MNTLQAFFVIPRIAAAPLARLTSNIGSSASDLAYSFLRINVLYEGNEATFLFNVTAPSLEKKKLEYC